MHNKCRRQRKQPTKPAITLSLEALEPRLVLSAVGFGFEGTHGQLGSHDRHHANREANRPAFAEQFHGNRGYEFANRFESNLPIPARADLARGAWPNETFLANFVEHDRHGPRFNDRAGKPPVNAEGEATVSTGDFESTLSDESVEVIFPTNLRAEMTVARTTLVFVSLNSTVSPARGDVSGFGLPTTRLTQLPEPFSADAVSQQSSSAATLIVAVPGSSSAASRTPPILPSIESSTIRSDSGSSSSEAVSFRLASESTRIIEPGIASFTSQATNDWTRWSNVDSESFEIVFDTVDQLPKSTRAAAAVDRASASLNDPAEDRIAGHSEESYWASEGGFVEIDSDAVDNSHARFEFAEDSNDASGSKKRLWTGTPRDTFWFEIGDKRLDLMLDPSLVEQLAEERARDDADDTDEDAWLLDDGGMIVLTSSQFIHQAVEVTVDDTGESPTTGETAAGDTDIPMDAGIEVFQAIEVAASPVEQQDATQASETTPAAIEGEAAAQADDVPPVEEQSAQNSESPEPIRAASMPLLLAVSALLSRGREIRKKVADRRRHA